MTQTQQPLTCSGGAVQDAVALESLQAGTWATRFDLLGLSAKPCLLCSTRWDNPWRALHDSFHHLARSAIKTQKGHGPSWG